MVKVRALELCFYHNALHKPGSVLEVSKEEARATYFETVAGSKPKKAPKDGRADGGKEHVEAPAS